LKIARPRRLGGFPRPPVLPRMCRGRAAQGRPVRFAAVALGAFPRPRGYPGGAAKRRKRAVGASNGLVGKVVAREQRDSTVAARKAASPGPGGAIAWGNPGKHDDRWLWSREQYRAMDARFRAAMQAAIDAGTERPPVGVDRRPGTRHPVVVLPATSLRQTGWAA
jgi:hypothetical protein